MQNIVIFITCSLFIATLSKHMNVLEPTNQTTEKSLHNNVDSQCVINVCHKITIQTNDGSLKTLCNICNII